MFIYFILYHTSEQPLTFYVTPRAELKFSDTNPKPVSASGNAKKKKISALTTAKRLQKKRTLPLLRMNTLTSRFFLVDRMLSFLFSLFFREIAILRKPCISMTLAESL